VVFTLFPTVGKMLRQTSRSPASPRPCPATVKVVFFHRPTKSLITADLFWNYPTEVPFGTRAWKWGMDKV